ncbi:MAG TPA: D-alanyl-D-alanine carboxypeptidase family protein [Rhizomicrobium sp.]|nr:D-alanyl-D-alanine carboxypeptidase family protein [Rhizomicrobium sp.]
MAFKRLGFLVVLFAFVQAGTAQALITTDAEHAVLMDGETGQVLWSKDGDVAMPPASMSKLMTLELLFQRLKDGRVKLTNTFPVSERAWRTQGSKSFVELGANIPIEDLIRGIIIQSGNDACMVVAEALGGSMENFVTMMNARAKELGLLHSHFVNPDGLPDPPGQLMSAMDLAKLARHLIYEYPQYYHYFGEREFTWHNIRQPNRNLVLEKFPGADGLKTGHTDAAGYGVTASAVQDGHRLILVVNGLRYPDKNDWWAERYRAEEAARILGIAFREFRQYKLFGANDTVATAKIWHGTKDSVAMVLGAPLAETMQVDSRKDLKVSVQYSSPLEAPIAKGQRIGALTLSAPGFPARSYALYAAEAIDRAGIISRGLQGLSLLLGSKDAK